MGVDENVYVPKEPIYDYDEIFVDMGMITGARYDIVAANAKNAPDEMDTFCLTIKHAIVGNMVIGSQFAFSADGKIYVRVYFNKPWSNWTLVN